MSIKTIAITIAYILYVESTMAGSGRCRLSTCWSDFQTEVRTVTHDDWNLADRSGSCFESVLSHPEALGDVRLKTLHQIRSRRDQPAGNSNPASSRRDLNPGLGSRVNGSHPAVRSRTAGPAETAGTRRRRSVDHGVDERRRKLCSALR